jgi:hypothetical protein
MAVSSMEFDCLNSSTKPGRQVCIANRAQERILFSGPKGLGRTLRVLWDTQMRSPKAHSIDSAIENPCALLIRDGSWIASSALEFAYR